MQLNTTKQMFLDLTKTANDAVNKAGLNGQTARVALVLDISGSMSNLFRNHTVQAVVERLLALGIQFDSDKAIDIFLFGVENHEVGQLRENDFLGYVDRVITPKYSLEGGTYYAGVMKRVMKKYVPEFGTTKGGFVGKLFGGKSTPAKMADEPVYVIFITDGDNQDHQDTEAVIKEAANYGVFWKFVGIGSQSFGFLQRLDDMSGRLIDNADFIQMNDISCVSDQELFDRLLNEFPGWIKEARDKQLIR